MRGTTMSEIDYASDPKEVFEDLTGEQWSQDGEDAAIAPNPTAIAEIVQEQIKQGSKTVLPVKEWEEKIDNANLPEEIKEALRQEIVEIQEEVRKIEAGEAPPLRIFSTNQVPRGASFRLP